MNRFDAVQAAGRAQVAASALAGQLALLVADIERRSPDVQAMVARAVEARATLTERMDALLALLNQEAEKTHV